MSRIGMIALVLSSATAAVSATAAAQAPSCPVPPNGAPAWFDFQVETPATFAGDTTARPFPDVTRASRRPYPPDFALAQFIVDTTGAATPTSLKLLVTPEGLSIDTVRAALPNWRFVPAKIRGCRVPQLVMTPLRWK